MPYRVGPLPIAPARPLKWPHQIAVAIATFFGIAGAVMVWVDFSAGYASAGFQDGERNLFRAAALAGALASLALGVRWRWSRIGWPIGVIAALVFGLSGAPALWLKASRVKQCDRGGGYACAAIGDHRRACDDGASSSCQLLLQSQNDSERQYACAALAKPCAVADDSTMLDLRKLCTLRRDRCP